MESGIAVIGAGAVGCYFGGMLARSGARVTFIGRAPHVMAMNRDGLLLQSANFEERIPVSASTGMEAIRGAEIVLLCVKTLDTEDAAKALAPYLASGSRLVSLQNGVDNVERVYASIGVRAIPAVVYVAAEMTGPGAVKHNGRGDLILGELDSLVELFERAGVPCRVSQNIAADLWTKMIMNCAYNAISALGRSNYAKIAGDTAARELMGTVIEEAVAVAAASGVALSCSSLFEAALKLGETMANATSSMAQDMARGRRTEIDSLNGYVVRRGLELGVPAPANKVLRSLVKLLEPGEM